MNPHPQNTQSAEELVEKLAAIEHERWADWQKYCHSKGIRDSSGIRLTIDSVERWERQINTPYAALSEKEKESDREQVRRYWPIIEAYILAITQNGGIPRTPKGCSFCSPILMSSKNDVQDSFRTSLTTAIESERATIAGVVLPKVQKFIDKVENGRARSKETYADMLEIKQYFNPKE